MIVKFVETWTIWTASKFGPGKQPTLETIEKISYIKLRRQEVVEDIQN